LAEDQAGAEKQGQPLGQVLPRLQAVQQVHEKGMRPGGVFGSKGLGLQKIGAIARHAQAPPSAITLSPGNGGNMYSTKAAATSTA